MISKFKNLYKRTNLDEKKDFQNRIIKFIGKQHPNLKVEKSDDPLLIVWDENKLGLTNLYNDFLLSSQTNFDFEELAKEHFDKVFSCGELLDEELKPFNEIESSILPQLMPIEFAQQFPAIYFPFGSEVSIGFVVDGEKAYHYLTEDDLKQWNIEPPEIYDTAVRNLAEISDKLKMTYVPPPNGLLVINTMDSFDAVRILVPHIQEFIAEKLGESFYFGIPNRDFLICWSKENDDEFYNKMKNQISADFEEQSYPLSKFIFEMSEDSAIVQKTFEASETKISDFINN